MLDATAAPYAPLPTPRSLAAVRGALRVVRETRPDRDVDLTRATVPCRSPRDVHELMAPLAARESAEVMWALMLDTQHRVIGDAPVVITRGILNSSLVHPREVFRAAILANAGSVILVHNHPSGDPTPSGDDRMVTEQLVAAGRMLDLPVRDHVIVGDGRYVSFSESGLL